MVVRIAQLTDLHLTARAGGRVFGSDVWGNLERALAHVATLPAVDRLVLTGDLANSGSAEAYSRLAERLAPWRSLVRILPGNHDHRERLRAAFPEQWATAGRLAFVDDVGGLRLVGLDSLCQGRTRGELGGAQLAWLREQVAAGDRPWLLLLHHPPVRVRCWWLDKDLLRDRDELGAILAVRPPCLILGGHVHQEHTGEFGGARVCTAPAVAYQYRPRSWLPMPCSREWALRVVEFAGGVATTRVERA